MNSFARMTNPSLDSETADDLISSGGRGGAGAGTGVGAGAGGGVGRRVGVGGGGEFPFQNAVKRTNRFESANAKKKNVRSLFIFGEDNFVRKYSQTIIEWGYPLNNHDAAHVYA